MAEKSFREIEAEVTEKGFRAVLTEGVCDIQNITRTLGYLLEVTDRDDTQRVAEINAITGVILRAGVALYRFMATVPEEETL